MVSPLAAVMTRGTHNAYEHCEIKLHLKEGKNGKAASHRFSYPLDHTTDDQINKELSKKIEDTRKLFKSLKLAVTNELEKVLNFHSCEEYEARLLACKGDLASRTIDDLYADKSIVEGMMNVNYEPVILTRFENEESSRISSNFDEKQIRE